MEAIYDSKLIDENGNALPWITYPAIEYIRQLDLSDKSIFEYGCGNSTEFFTPRCKSIVSIEQTEEWWTQMVRRIGNRYPVNNCIIKLIKERQTYTDSIKSMPRNSIDLIVIDGWGRHECALLAPDYLAEGGMILFDNTNWYVESSNFLRSKGLIQIDFHGMSPMNDYGSTTSIFMKRNFNFRPLEDSQPKMPIGGNLIYNCGN